jgi:hypothetical protein
VYVCVVQSSLQLIAKRDIELKERIGGGHFADVFKASWVRPRSTLTLDGMRRLALSSS